MNKQTYMFIDTETGGFDPFKHSLLSVGIVIGKLQNDLKRYSLKTAYKKEFFVKAFSTDAYVCTPEALSINGIDLQWLQENGISEEDVVREIKKLRAEYFGSEKISVVGHNIDFDFAFMRKLFNNVNQDFSCEFNHRAVNTASILKYLNVCGVIEKDISSLDAAIQHFGIKIKKRHSALDDCLATAEIFEKLVNLRLGILHE